MRISRPQMFLEIAQVVAKRATCMRLNVGAIAVKDRSIVSIGYNGQPAGEPHCSGNDCPGKFGCHLTTHAEINALNRLPASVSGPIDLYVTDSPCDMCYDRILRGGRSWWVSRVFFGTPYRITDHLAFREGVFQPEVYRVLPAGYVLNWRTKELEDVDV